MPISGSFVRGNSTGRIMSFSSVYNKLSTSSSVALTSPGAIYNLLSESSSILSILNRNRSEAEVFVIGAAQGIGVGESATIDGNGSFGRHLQIGVNKETTEGTPSAPSLRLDYPGNMWRFRWVVKVGNRSMSVSAKQNSTGSAYRPSMVIKANTAVGLMYDVSSSAADGAGWVTIGPVTFTAGASDVLWVELHNNNYNSPTINGTIPAIPAYFDHIVAT